MSEIAAVTPQVLSRRTQRRIPIGVLLAGLFVLLVIVCALAGNYIAPVSPSQQDLSGVLQGPSAAHWLGTDNLGRDVLSRLIAGAGSSLAGPAIIAVGGMLFGVALGTAAGYYGGWVDVLISRWIDLMYSIPSLLVAIVVVGVLGGGYWIATFVLLILFVPFNARILRGVALEQRGRPYVEAARTLGLSHRHIMTRHIVPVAAPVIISTTVLDFAFALVSLSGLSFLGLGAPPGAADWGRELADGIQYIYQAPLVVIAPGVAIMLTAMSINLLGDWIFEAALNYGKSR